MFFLYQLILVLILLTSPLIIIYRIIKKKEDPYRFKEKFCFFSKTRKTGRLIWIHASSVGEAMSIIPIIHCYEKNKKINQILITTSTLSSAKILKKFKFKKTIHQFFPIDFFLFSKKFLDYWKPTVAIFVESEIWPGMFNFINKKKIPLILLNARITKKSFSKWLKIKNFALSTFKNISIAFPQNLETKIFLKKLNIKIVKFIGNLKFVQNPYDNTNSLNNSLKSRFKNSHIWIAASTHEKEELICAEAHILLKKKIKNLITIIIPRHINRVKKISSDLRKLNLNVICHSSNSKNFKDLDIYLVDSYGESKNFYKISNTVFLGGSLINKGGQNPLEPARYGSKILAGKYVSNFKDIYSFLNKIGVSKTIMNAKEISNSIIFNSTNNKKKTIQKIGEEILKDTTYQLNKILTNAIEKT